jgi:hypothetical protein
LQYCASTLPNATAVRLSALAPDTPWEQLTVLAAGLGLAWPDLLGRTRLLVDFALDGPGTLLLPGTTSFAAASPWLPWADFVGTWAPFQSLALL